MQKDNSEVKIRAECLVIKCSHYGISVILSRVDVNPVVRGGSMGCGSNFPETRDRGERVQQRLGEVEQAGEPVVPKT